MLLKVLVSSYLILQVQAAGLARISSPRLDLNQPCVARQVDGNPQKIICVCNERACPGIRLDWPSEPGEAILVQSSQAGKRFLVSDVKEAGNRSGVVEIEVDLNDERQTVLGFGGAFTDSATINFNKLSPELRSRLLQSYYGRDGLQYTLGRVPISGSDFSTHPYSYDDTVEPDYSLSNWTLQPEDLEYKIPNVKAAIEIVEGNGDELKLFASSWSPPRWMKDNGDFVRGKLIDDDRVYRSYAEYLMRFFDAYKDLGVEFWGATVQNEPFFAASPSYPSFNSLGFDSEQMIEFIANYLGPALSQRGFDRDNFKLIIGDDPLGYEDGTLEVLNNTNAAKYISGFAFHWYFSGTRHPYSTLSDIYHQIKDKIEFFMMTEACNGSDGPTKVDLGSWPRAEAYARDIIEDFRYRTDSWVDWNLALDLEGGPNWAANQVDSPILVNSEDNEFYQQPMYHVLGHFSRFFRPGSVYIGSSIGGNLPDILVAAVHVKATGHVAVNILNTANDTRAISLRINSKKNSFSIDARSMNSFLVKI